MSKTKRKEKGVPPAVNDNDMPALPIMEAAPAQAVIPRNEPEFVAEEASDDDEPEDVPSSGQLIAHCGTNKITRAELQTLSTPAATRSTRSAIPARAR